MGSRRAQRGAGASGIFLSMVAFVVVLTVVVKLGPSYMSYWTLKSVMDGLVDLPGSTLKSRQMILDRLDGQMHMNNIAGVALKDFTVQKTADDTFDVQVAYERRHHLFANVDAVLTFSYGVAVKSR